MTRFTLKGTGCQFDAIELRRVGDRTHPIVDGRTAHQVAATMGRRLRWFGKNLAVAARGLDGEVIEILRPDEDGAYDLASINWLGDRPDMADQASAPHPSPSPARVRAGVRGRA